MELQKDIDFALYCLVANKKKKKNRERDWYNYFENKDSKNNFWSLFVGFKIFTTRIHLILKRLKLVRSNNSMDLIFGNRIYKSGKYNFYN